MKNEAPLPFDYDKELIGARTPCLEGQKNFMKAARELGFRYDTSGVNNQVWPEKKSGLWDLSMQLVPFPGHSFEQLTMDYNFMVNQSGTTTQGDPGKHEMWGDQMRDGLLQGFERAYDGNRAPLIIGNHFESWNGGTYMRAVEEVVEEVCTKSDVRCVSFRQLVDWLDAQDPATLEKLRSLGVGEAPKQGWKTFLASGPAPAPRARRVPPRRRSEAQASAVTLSPSTKPGSTCAARSAPVRSFPHDWAFFRWKCTIWRVYRSRSRRSYVASAASRSVRRASRLDSSSAANRGGRPFSMARTQSEWPTVTSRSSPTSARRKSRSSGPCTLLPTTFSATPKSRAYSLYWR